MFLKQANSDMKNSTEKKSKMSPEKSYTVETGKYTIITP